MGSERKELVHGITQFSGTGYENWRFHVEKFLKPLELLDAIKKEAPAGNAAQAERTKFEELDAKAVNVIVTFIHDDLLDLIRDKETAREIWTTLENIYAKKSAASQTLGR